MCQRCEKEKATATCRVSNGLNVILKKIDLCDSCKTYLREQKKFDVKVIEVIK